MKKFRILIIRNAYQKDAGGAEQYALNLAIALKQQGHVPILVTKVTKIIDKACSAGVRVHPGKWHDSQEWGKHYFLRFPLMVLWYMWVILLHRVDVVHPQGRDDFIFATYAGWLLRKRVVWTDHADLKVVLDKQLHPFRHLRRWLIKASRKAHNIIVVSEAEKSAILKAAPDLQADKLVVVYNGVFKPVHVQPVEKQAFVVGTNARLVPDKGIAELIEGFAKSKLHAAELWLLGGQSDNQDIYERLAEKLGIKQRVRFIGYVNNPNDYVAAMDIFVHASYMEAFSLAIIEAAMLKRPIIATAVGGTPEIISDACGILVPPRDASAITAALNKLCDDPALAAQLAEKAHKLAYSEFDFDKIVSDKVLPLYRGSK